MPDTSIPQDPGEPTVDFTPLFDTGSVAVQSDPMRPLVAEPDPTVAPDSVPQSVLVDDESSDAIPEPAHPVAVPGEYQYLKRWKFVAVVTGVWLVAAAVGLGLFYWWFHSLDKTPPVFVLLMYLVFTTVSGLIIAMAQYRPLLSALSIAIMSAPFASTVAAAVLYGVYFCEQAARCLVGVIPY